MLSNLGIWLRHRGLESSYQNGRAFPLAQDLDQSRWVSGCFTLPIAIVPDPQNGMWVNVWPATLNSALVVIVARPSILPVDVFAIGPRSTLHASIWLNQTAALIRPSFWDSWRLICKGVMAMGVGSRMSRWCRSSRWCYNPGMETIPIRHACGRGPDLDRACWRPERDLV